MKKAKTKKTTAKTKSTKRATTKTKPTAKASSSKVLLAYGYGEDGRPRAAAFTEPDLKLARKAAGQLGLKVFVASAVEFKGKLGGVKSGNAFASGDGFAPKVSDKRLDELLSLLKLPLPTRPEPSAAVSLPVSWDAIAVGHTVLGLADDPAWGYWAATIETVQGDSLGLRAVDLPEVLVTRDRYAVALAYTPAFRPYSGQVQPAPGLPLDWDSLKPGHLVIAPQARDEGGSEALVVKVEGDKVTLKWRDHSDLPAFTRKRNTLALLYPAAPVGMPAEVSETADKGDAS